MTAAQTIYDLLEQGTPGVNEFSAADTLLDWIYDLCLAGEFSKAEATLLSMDLERLDTHLTVGVLLCAYACALPCFDALLPKVRARLTTLAPDRVDKILQGLTAETFAQRRSQFKKESEL